MVSTEKFMQGVLEYCEKEIISALPAQGWQQFALGTIMTLAQTNANKVLEEIKKHPFLIAVGMFENDGMINVSDVKNAMIKRIDSNCVKIDVPCVGPYTFYKHDIEKLYTYIMNA